MEQIPRNILYKSYTKASHYERSSKKPHKMIIIAND